MVHLIIYAGAILVLFLFVIMLLGIRATDLPLTQRFKISHILTGGAVSVGLFLFIITIIKDTHIPKVQGVIGSVEAVAISIFGDFLLPFELVSILIIVGIFAAVSLAKEDTAVSSPIKDFGDDKGSL